MQTLEQTRTDRMKPQRCYPRPRPLIMHVRITRHNLDARPLIMQNRAYAWLCPQWAGDALPSYSARSALAQMRSKASMYAVAMSPAAAARRQRTGSRSAGMP